MPPLESTRDIMYLAISISIVGIAFFVCWSLYYFAQSLRDIRIMTKDTRQRVESFWEVIELLREKLQVGGAVFKVAATGIKELAEHMKSFSEDEKKSKKKK